jgi:hypothetical protein
VRDALGKLSDRLKIEQNIHQPEDLIRFRELGVKLR